MYNFVFSSMPHRGRKYKASVVDRLNRRYKTDTVRSVDTDTMNRLIDRCDELQAEPDWKVCTKKKGVNAV